MSENKIFKKNHFLLISRISEIPREETSRNNLILINKLRDYIASYIVLEEESYIHLYFTYCSIPYMQVIVKIFNELKTTYKIRVSIGSSEVLLNKIEKDLTKAEQEDFITIKSVINLNKKESIITIINEQLLYLLTKFEINNNFERIELE
jgi:hypothetical protein